MEEKEIRGLEQWRAIRGLSRAKLGKLAGVTEHTILRVGQRKHKPYPQTAYKLAQALGVELEQVIEFREDAPDPKAEPGAAGMEMRAA